MRSILVAITISAAMTRLGSAAGEDLVLPTTPPLGQPSGVSPAPLAPAVVPAVTTTEATRLPEPVYWADPGVSASTFDDESGEAFDWAELDSHLAELAWTKRSEERRV